MHGTVELQVSDDGTGITDVAGGATTNGIGSRTHARDSKNCTARLTAHHVQAVGGGLQVSITIPFHTACRARREIISWIKSAR